MRTLTEQREQTPSMGEVRVQVRWLDECTYQLFDREVVGTELFPRNHTDTVTVHIVSSDETGFNYEARATFVDGIVQGRQLYEQQ
jgi:hypothetical protein